MPGKGDKKMAGRISQILRSVPRTESNGDLYAPPEIDSSTSVDDLIGAVEQARNELVIQEAELCRAQQLHEDMKSKLAEAINKRELGVTASVTVGRRH